MSGSRKAPAPLPTKQQILDFVRDSKTPVGRREIARAFQVKGGDRTLLNAMLKELKADGQIEAGNRREKGGARKMAKPGSLPAVAVLEAIGPDPDGELLARPVMWHGAGDPPRIYVAPEHGHAAIGRGDRVLARLARIEEGVYEARVIRRIGVGAQRIVGVFARAAKGERAGKGSMGGRIRPTDRRNKSEYQVPPDGTMEARDGELVLAEALPGRRHGLPEARVVERVGRIDEPRAYSLIAIHTHDIPVDFPAEAMEEAERAAPVALGQRTDLRAVPLVTIDGADARDFDDAVWAEPDPDPANRGGWHAVVAIADVAWYVRAHGPLDRAARKRGNSVYFPDRVVPMLPEKLSNDLCSLRPDEARACMAVHLWFDSAGVKRGHRFVRGLMRSSARLTYEQVQGAMEGRTDAATAPLVEGVIRPLYGVFTALLDERERRGTLDLDVPERKAVLGEDGRVVAIERRQRLDSHRVIEELMIAANVAAAETLERVRQPCMYRVHDAPTPEKAEAVRSFLDGLGYRLAKGQVLKPIQFTQLLAQAKGRPEEQLVHEIVLRSQALAVYSPDNIGHFGLALRRYAHFTSPIRRYADLLVHRGLIAGLGLGEGGLNPAAPEDFTALAEDISRAERRAVSAERDAADRYVASFLAGRVGESFAGRINGVTRFGLFVTLSETGADGLVPISTLPRDFYDHDERGHRLVGRSHGREYRLGEKVEVRLREADTTTGGMLFELLEGEEAPGAMLPPRGPTRPARGRPGGFKRGSPGKGKSGGGKPGGGQARRRR
ncbi:MAG: ribonuclease R [Alphaproteobacteria bacterium]|nr:ribonuclease R [Alphaproteobacteria bacterium]